MHRPGYLSFKVRADAHLEQNAYFTMSDAYFTMIIRCTSSTCLQFTTNHIKAQVVYILYFHFLFQVSHFHFLLFYFTAPELVLGNKWLEPMLNIRVYCSSLPFMSLYNGFSRRLKQFIVIHFKFPMTDKIPIIGGKQVKFQLFDFMAERWTI